MPIHLFVTVPLSSTTSSVPVDTHSLSPLSLAVTCTVGPASGVAPAQAEAAGGVPPAVGLADGEGLTAGDVVDEALAGEEPADGLTDELAHALISSTPPTVRAMATVLLDMISLLPHLGRRIRPAGSAAATG